MTSVWKRSSMRGGSIGDFLMGLLELAGMVFWCILIIFFIVYIIPAVVSLGVNFYQSVVVGTMKMSEFKGGIFEIMFGPVNEFYIGVWDQFQDLIIRITT